MSVTPSKINNMTELAAYLTALKVEQSAVFTSAVYDSTAGTITLKTAESVAGAGATANDAFCVIKDYVSGSSGSTASMDIYVDNSGTPIRFAGGVKPFPLTGKVSSTYVSMFPIYAYQTTKGVIFGTALDQTDHKYWSYFGFCKTQLGKVAVFGYNTVSNANEYGYGGNTAALKQSNPFFSTVYGAQDMKGQTNYTNANNGVLVLKRGASDLFGSGNNTGTSSETAGVTFTSFFEPPIFGTEGDRLKNVFVNITSQQDNDNKTYGILQFAGHKYLTNGFAALLDE